MKLSIGPLTGKERDGMDRFLLAEALPAFFAQFSTAGVAPALEAERPWPLSEDFRYLPVRSEIV